MLLNENDFLFSKFQLEHLSRDYNGSALTLIESLSRYVTQSRCTGSWKVVCLFMLPVIAMFCSTWPFMSLAIFLLGDSDHIFFTHSLVVLGNNTEFERAIIWLSENLTFDIDVRINLFEVLPHLIEKLLAKSCTIIY